MKVYLLGSKPCWGLLQWDADSLVCSEAFSRHIVPQGIPTTYSTIIYLFITFTTHVLHLINLYYYIFNDSLTLPYPSQIALTCLWLNHTEITHGSLMEKVPPSSHSVRVPRFWSQYYAFPVWSRQQVPHILCHIPYCYWMFFGIFFPDIMIIELSIAIFIVTTTVIIDTKSTDSNCIVSISTPYPEPVVGTWNHSTSKMSLIHIQYSSETPQIQLPVTSSVFMTKDPSLILKQTHNDPW